MASGVSIIFLSPEPKELYNKLNILIPEKQAGNISDTIDEEINAIAENY